MFHWPSRRTEFINYNMYRTFCIAALAAAALTACDKPSDKAKREYLMMLKSGASLEERCRKKQEIASAFLAEENHAEYPMAKIEADMKCNEVALARLRYR